MSQTYLPSTDAGLLNWAQNFSDLINISPATYGLTEAQATNFESLFNIYDTAYQTAVTPSTRTQGAIAAKNTAKQNLKADARLLVSIIQGQASVTNQQKVDLGITVRDVEPTPVPPPTDAPEMDIQEVKGRTVFIRLHNDQTLNRRKPEGVKGASVFSFVGETPPEEISAWKFEFSTTKLDVSVEFPVMVPQGAKVWLTAFWFNPTMQSGPACTPENTYLQYGGLAQAA